MEGWTGIKRGLGELIPAILGPVTDQGVNEEKYYQSRVCL